MKNLESFRIGLKEIICILEVCRSSSSSSYARGLETIIDLCNLHPPPLHQVHKARVPQAVLLTGICVKVNSSEHLIRYGSIDKGPSNLNLPATAEPLQPRESNLPYLTLRATTTMPTTPSLDHVLGRRILNLGHNIRHHRSKFPQVGAWHHTWVIPDFRLTWLEHGWHY